MTQHFTKDERTPVLDVFRLALGVFIGVLAALITHDAIRVKIAFDGIKHFSEQMDKKMAKPKQPADKESR
ncbi:hypothetical protein FSY59_16670 [Comamonas sp. Z3]|uniref:hypothetical protein n=1 Tax=Comamonas sp. Z3 TaxID=2601247 RepID=UPI0011E70DAC|nr:hypothetical protein [Comamonas sp. Z3]TYK69945.1 hypothetical protein FSY59_16670 [Comamonas sp. Z3]